MKYLLVVSLMLLSFVGKAQDKFHTGGNVKVRFGMGFYTDKDTDEKVLYFNLGGGTLHEGDSIEFSAGGGRGIYLMEIIEDINMAKEGLDIPIDDGMAQAFMKSGITYLQVNDEIYWFNTIYRFKIKKQAKKAFKK